MSDEREDPWAYGVTAGDAGGSWPPAGDDRGGPERSDHVDEDEADDDDTIRHHTGRWTSPSLGSYDPASAHEALTGGNGADDAYFRDFGYGEGFGDGRLAAGYDAGSPAPAAPSADAVPPPEADAPTWGAGREVPPPERGSDRGGGRFAFGRAAGALDDTVVDDERGGLGGIGQGFAEDRDQLDELEADPGEDDDGSGARRNLIEWGVVLVGAVLLALVLRALVLQAFWIPSPSMETTLLVRDRVLVNKVSYRIGDIGRGDIIVFRRTDAEIEQNPELPRDVIKRVIALEGETIEIIDNQVFIDGLLLQEPYLDDGITTGDFGPETVPDGHVFVMGDNRELSLDSRFETGPISEDRVVGRAFFLFWPLDRMGSL